MPRPGRIASTLLSAALLAGCAALPEDRGMPQVQALLQERGLPAVSAPDKASAKLVDGILAGNPLSADDAVRVALLSSPELRADYARLGFSAAEVYDAGRLSNPVLSGAVLFTGTPGAVDRYDYGLSQDFLGLLLLPARSRLAQAEFERTRLEVGAAILARSATVQAAYYRLIAAQEAQRLQQIVAEAADTSAQLAQRYFDAGNLPELELELNLAEAAQAQADAAASHQEALAARIDLRQLMGLTPDRDGWRVPEHLPAPPAQEDSLAELRTLAERSRLDLAAKRRELAALEDALGVARSYRLLGDAAIGVQGERDADGTHLLGPTLSLQLPLFNQGEGTKLRAQARLEQARAELDVLELQAANTIALAQSRVASARERAERYHRDVVPRRERVVALAQERANFMLIGPFELIRARREEYDGYRGYLDSLRDYWLARSELAREVGARLPSDGAVTGEHP